MNTALNNVYRFPGRAPEERTVKPEQSGKGFALIHRQFMDSRLKAKMLAESEPRTTISFYKYFHIADPKATRDALYQLFTADRKSVV